MFSILLPVSAGTNFRSNQRLQIGLLLLGMPEEVMTIEVDTIILQLLEGWVKVAEIEVSTGTDNGIHLHGIAPCHHLEIVLCQLMATVLTPMDNRADTRPSFILG